MFAPMSPLVRELSKLMHYRAGAYAVFDPEDPLFVRHTATGWVYAPHRQTWWKAFWFYQCILVIVVFIWLYCTEWTWTGAFLALLAAYGVSVLMAYASTVKKELVHDELQQTWTYSDEKTRTVIPIGVIHNIRVEEVVYFNADQLPMTYVPQVQYFSAEGDLLSFRLGTYTFQPQAVLVVRWLKEQALAVAPFIKIDEVAAD